MYETKCVFAGFGRFRHRQIADIMSVRHSLSLKTSVWRQPPKDVINIGISAPTPDNCHQHPLVNIISVVIALTNTNNHQLNVTNSAAATKMFTIVCLLGFHVSNSFALPGISVMQILSFY